MASLGHQLLKYRTLIQGCSSHCLSSFTVIASVKTVTDEAAVTDIAITTATAVVISAE